MELGKRRSQADKLTANQFIIFIVARSFQSSSPSSKDHSLLFPSNSKPNMSTFKTSFVGNLINQLSSGRFLPLPDQKEDFEIPAKFLKTRSSDLDLGSLENNKIHSPCSTIVENESSNTTPIETEQDQKIHDEEKGEMGKAKKLDEKETKQLKGADGKDIIIVDWYDENDPENPQ